MPRPSPHTLCLKTSIAPVWTPALFTCPIALRPSLLLCSRSPLRCQAARLRRAVPSALLLWVAAPVLPKAARCASLGRPTDEDRHAEDDLRRAAAQLPPPHLSLGVPPGVPLHPAAGPALPSLPTRLPSPHPRGPRAKAAVLAAIASAAASAPLVPGGASQCGLSTDFLRQPDVLLRGVAARATASAPHTASALGRNRTMPLSEGEMPASRDAFSQLPPFPRPATPPPVRTSPLLSVPALPLSPARMPVPPPLRAPSPLALQVV